MQTSMGFVCITQWSYTVPEGHGSGTNTAQQLYVPTRSLSVWTTSRISAEVLLTIQETQISSFGSQITWNCAQKEVDKHLSLLAITSILNSVIFLFIESDILSLKMELKMDKHS